MFCKNQIGDKFPRKYKFLLPVFWFLLSLADSGSTAFQLRRQNPIVNYVTSLGGSIFVLIMLHLLIQLCQCRTLGLSSLSLSFFQWTPIQKVNYSRLLFLLDNEQFIDNTIGRFICSDNISTAWWPIFAWILKRRFSIF